VAPDGQGAADGWTPVRHAGVRHLGGEPPRQLGPRRGSCLTIAPLMMLIDCDPAPTADAHRGAALGRSSSPLDLIDRMMSIHGDRANPYTVWVAADDLLGKKPA